MKIGMIGLGRMGLNMARRLARGGIEVAAYNRTVQKAKDFAAEEGKNASAAETLAELVALLPTPRVVWLMLPAGAATDEHIEELLPLLASGDTIVDGGNTYFRDDQRRHATAGKCGIRYCDAGVSGGIWGLAEGYCIMRTSSGCCSYIQALANAAAKGANSASISMPAMKPTISATAFLLPSLSIPLRYDTNAFMGKTLRASAMVASFIRP